MSRRNERHASSRRVGVLGSLLVFSMVLLAASGIGLASQRYQDLALFTSVLEHVRANYVEPVGEHELLAGALNGMLRELDPHSAFLDRDAYKEMQVDTRGEFHGLGIEITKRQGDSIEVVSPIDGTPAARAGIHARDRIVSICPTEVPESWAADEKCRSTKNMSLLEAVQLMRGRKGSSITIHIYREGFEMPQPFEIVRDVVQMESVTSRILEEGYGYLRVAAFQERTEIELLDALNEIHAAAPGGLKGVVLDLRDNPGGLLDQAVRVADLWLEEGIIVYTQGRVESERQDYLATPDNTEADYPVVILVNEGSASASEIVAGALQDHNRALVIGLHSFGKGSVQTVYPLDGGAALRLTTALYYTPSGRSIQETGIMPDIEVEPAPILVEQRRRPQRLREKDLEGHFTQEEADPTAKDDDRESKEAPVERPDPQLDRGLEVLKSWRYFDKLRDAPASKAEVLPSGAPQPL